MRLRILEPFLLFAVTSCFRPDVMLCLSAICGISTIVLHYFFFVFYPFSDQVYEATLSDVSTIDWQPGTSIVISEDMFVPRSVPIGQYQVNDPVNNF